MADRTVEIRTMAAGVELREAGGEGALVISGYAATFNSAYDMGPFRETVDPLAFRDTLAQNADVRLLIDHMGQPLARTRSGTLQLTPDDHGLHMRANLDPADPDVQRLTPKMRRGDLDQMSIAFRVFGDDGDTWDYTTGDKPVRTLRTLNLNGGDVSVVTYPANPGTSVALRALDLREAQLVFVAAQMTEVRAGKAISADNLVRLTRILTALATADECLDDAVGAVADILGVPNPDVDDTTDDATDPGDTGDTTGAARSGADRAHTRALQVRLLGMTAV